MVSRKSPFLVLFSNCVILTSHFLTNPKWKGITKIVSNSGDTPKSTSRLTPSVKRRYIRVTVN